MNIHSNSNYNYDHPYEYENEYQNRHLNYNSINTKNTKNYWNTHSEYYLNKSKKEKSNSYAMCINDLSLSFINKMNNQIEEDYNLWIESLDEEKFSKEIDSISNNPLLNKFLKLNTNNFLDKNRCVKSKEKFDYLCQKYFKNSNNNNHKNQDKTNKENIQQRIPIEIDENYLSYNERNHNHLKYDENVNQINNIKFHKGYAYHKFNQLVNSKIEHQNKNEEIDKRIDDFFNKTSNRNTRKDNNYSNERKNEYELIKDSFSTNKDVNNISYFDMFIKNLEKNQINKSFVNEEEKHFDSFIKEIDIINNGTNHINFNSIIDENNFKSKDSMSLYYKKFNLHVSYYYYSDLKKISNEKINNYSNEDKVEYSENGENQKNETENGSKNTYSSDLNNCKYQTRVFGPYNCLQIVNLIVLYEKMNDEVIKLTNKEMFPTHTILVEDIKEDIYYEAHQMKKILSKLLSISCNDIESDKYMKTPFSNDNWYNDYKHKQTKYNAYKTKEYLKKGPKNINFEDKFNDEKRNNSSTKLVDIDTFFYK